MPVQSDTEEKFVQFFSDDNMHVSRWRKEQTELNIEMYTHTNVL